MPELEVEVGQLLLARKMTFGAVESASGGLISHRMTNVSGCSACCKGSVTSYCNEIKKRLIGVKEETLAKYGAVSPQVAEEMAAGGRKVLNVDICVADTGIAGPAGGTPQKPVGLFFIGLATKDGVSSRRFEFHGDRLQNKQSAAEAALGWVKEYLLSL